MVFHRRAGVVLNADKTASQDALTAYAVHTLALCLCYHADTFTHLARVLNYAVCVPEPDPFHAHLAEGLRAQFPDYPCPESSYSSTAAAAFDKPGRQQLLHLLSRPIATHVAYLRPPVLSLPESWCLVNLILTWGCTAVLLMPPLRRRVPPRVRLAWLFVNLINDMFVPPLCWVLLRTAPPTSMRHYPPVMVEANGYTAFVGLPPEMVHVITALVSASLALITAVITRNHLADQLPYSLPNLWVRQIITALAVTLITAFRGRLWRAVVRCWCALLPAGVVGARGFGSVAATRKGTAMEMVAPPRPPPPRRPPPPSPPPSRWASWPPGETWMQGALPGADVDLILAGDLALCHQRQATTATQGSTGGEPEPLAAVVAAEAVTGPGAGSPTDGGSHGGGTGLGAHQERLGRLGNSEQGLGGEKLMAAGAAAAVSAGPSPPGPSPPGPSPPRRVPEADPGRQCERPGRTDERSPPGACSGERAASPLERPRRRRAPQHAQRSAGQGQEQERSQPPAQEQAQARCFSGRQWEGQPPLPQEEWAVLPQLASSAGAAAQAAATEEPLRASHGLAGQLLDDGEGCVDDAAGGEATPPAAAAETVTATCSAPPSAQPSSPQGRVSRARPGRSALHSAPPPPPQSQSRSGPAAASTMPPAEGKSAALTFEQLRAIALAARTAPYRPDPSFQLMRVYLQVPGLSDPDFDPGWRQAALQRLSTMLSPEVTVLSLTVGGGGGIVGSGGATDEVGGGLSHQGAGGNSPRA